MLRAGQSGGRAVLDELVRRFPADSLSTPTALFLLADLSRDAGQYSTAGRRYREVAERFPASAEAPRARFMAGLILYSQGKRADAARTWDSLFLGTMGREEGLSGGYWSGRALFELGDTAAGRARWRQVIARSRLSYYSRLSYRRLGLSDTTLSAGPDQFDRSSTVEKARQRLQLLSAAGMKPELGLEVTWLVSQAGNDLPNVVGTASLLRDHYRATYSAQLGWRALEAGAANSRTYRLIFPLLYEAPLVASSLEERVEPALTAALIRQESLFDSMATSRAGARGLMQIMPSVGREMARSRRRAGWHADSLYQPRVNLAFGTSHLAWALGRYGGLERTLAAYNAGGSRVTRWAGFPGSSDPEVFVEWIPFPETRTYVRTVLRNFEFYRGLYDWK
jgi:soluble lytic murein transglycosylase